MVETIEAVILDGDGVLLDSKDYALIYYPQVAVKMGFRKVDDEEFVFHWSIHWEEFLQIFWPSIVTKEFDDMYHQCGFDKETIPQIDESEQVLSLLEQQGYFLALVSNRGSKSLRKLLNIAGIDLNQFVGVLTGAADEDIFLSEGLSKDRIIPSIADLPALLQTM